MKTPNHRAIEIGSAGEHLVCADLILQGHRAYLAAQGLPYDVVADVGGRLLRVIVKSTSVARPRPAREGSRICYQFSIGRPRRLRSGLTDNRRYTCGDGDIVALVGLDRRRIAYLSIYECVTFVHIDHDDQHHGSNKFGPRNSVRKRFADFPFNRAFDCFVGVK